MSVALHSLGLYIAVKHVDTLCHQHTNCAQAGGSRALYEHAAQQRSSVATPCLQS
jgi:hypothetical protein